MFAVIFRAEIKNLDAEYNEMAKKMRDLALNQFGCKEFIAITEGDYEVAISYWDNEEQIKEWKQNAEHMAAQRKGQNNWYSAYTVQVVEIVREYSSSH